jgi:hypothetical protein
MMTQPPRRPPKKSELLEVRLSLETKQNFLAACRKAGRTASDVVREAIVRFIEAEERPEIQSGKRSLIAMIPTPIRKKRYLAVGAGLAGLAVFAALPSAAGPDLQATFKRLDANGDGVVTAQEFWGEEVSTGVVTETRSIVRKSAGAAEPIVSRDSFAVLQPPGSASGGRFSGGEDWGVRMMIGLRVSQSARNDDPRAHEFVGMDTNQDNKISFDEYRVRLHGMLSRGFGLLDTDSDGLLTAAEFAFSDDEEILSSRLYGGGKADCPYRECAQKWTLPDGTLAAGFAALDTDGDKRVSLAEYLAVT